METQTIPGILENLYQARAMTQEESQTLFSAIVKGELEPAQLAAALISMKVRGEQPAEIAGAAQALLADAQPFPALIIRSLTSLVPAVTAPTASTSRLPAPLLRPVAV